MSKPKFKCNVCGHEFRSKQDYPQCSDPNDECGRSRDVDKMADDTGATDESSSEDETPDTPESETETETENVDNNDSGGAWEPLFESETVTKDPPTDEEMRESFSGIDPDPYEPDSEGESDPESPPEFEGIPELEGEDIRPLIEIPFDMAADRRGEHWELSDKEAVKMSDAYARLGQKYLPHLLQEHAPEVMAAAVTLAVVLPRMQQDRKDTEDSESEGSPPDVTTGTENDLEGPSPEPQSTGGLAIENV